MSLQVTKVHANRIWIESDLWGNQHVVAQSQMPGADRHVVCTVHYDRVHADNAACSQISRAVAQLLGAGPDVEHTTRLPGPVDATVVPFDRAHRQTVVHAWCVAAFGDNHARSVAQRGIRLAEEAIETAQASGCDRAMLHHLVDYIYDRPIGELAQELGGVGVTLLALAQAAGICAETAECDEIQRILSKPLAHFAQRNAAKNAAGFDVNAAGQDAP